MFRWQIWIVVVTCCLDGAAAPRAQSTWQKPPLRFDIIVHNPNHDRAWHLLQIGVISDASGSFNCLGGATALMPLADYAVTFRITEKRTLHDADPPILIPPLDSAHFTIALYPDDRGACGPWTAKVAALMVFEGGFTLSTQTEQLDSSAVAASAKRPLSLADLNSAAHHRDSVVRESAMRFAGASGNNSADLGELVSQGLSDPSSSVRRAALEAAIKKPDPTLGPKLLEAAKQTNDWQELSLYCTALGNIPYVPAANFLVSVLLQAEPTSLQPAAAALRAMPSQQVVPQIRSALVEHSAWGTAAEWLTSRSLAYRALIDLLFAFGDASSADVLSNLLLNTPNPQLRAFLLSRIQENAAKPFAASFRPALDLLVHDPSLSIQRSAFPVLVAITPADDEKVAIIRIFLQSSDGFARADACRVAAQTHQIALISEIRRLFPQSQLPAERLACCQALQILGDKETKCSDAE